MTGREQVDRPDNRPMASPWTLSVVNALRTLMELSWYPSHDGLDDVFDSTGVTSPRVNERGEDMSKPKRLREALIQADARGKEHVERVAMAVVQEMQFRNVFSGPTNDSRVPEAVERVRSVLGSGGLILEADGTVTRGFSVSNVDLGDRETVERLLVKLRDPNLDPGAVIGTAKDLLEATAKHLLHESDPDAVPGDMPGSVSRAMAAIGLSKNPTDIGGPDAKGIAKAHQLVAGTAEAVTLLRNRAGDGHGHIELTAASRELADYVRNLTLAAVTFQLATAGRGKSD